MCRFLAQPFSAVKSPCRAGRLTDDHRHGGSRISRIIMAKMETPRQLPFYGGMTYNAHESTLLCDGVGEREKAKKRASKSKKVLSELVD